MQHAECLVIGGGLAGSMAAFSLAAEGRKVVLVEKERDAHDKVCGEFLSPEAVQYLRSAGIDPAAMGAEPIDRLRVSRGTRHIQVQLPFQALSLSRRVVDEALMQRAADQGCRVIRGFAVESLAREADQWIAQLASSEKVRVPSVFLATGKHDLRGWSRSAGRQNDLVGFKLHLRLTAAQLCALRGTMDLFLFRGGYGGLALVEGGVANLCLVVRREILRQVGAWPQLLRAIRGENKTIRERLEGAQALWERPLAISSIPYGYIAPAASGNLKLWRIGDQAAVIPSFTGDGMSIALHSAALAAQLYAAGSNPGEHARVLNQQLRQGMTLATLLSRAMVSSLGRRLGLAALAVLPGVLPSIASRTRIPAEFLLAGAHATGNARQNGSISPRAGADVTCHEEPVPSGNASTKN